MALPRSPSERRPQANEPIFDSHRLPIASSPAPLRHLPFLEPWRICFPSSLRASHQGLVSGEALAGFGSPTPSRHRASAGSSDHAGSIGWGRGPLPVTACPGAAGDGDMWQQFPSAVSLLHGCGGERTCRPRGGRGPADPGRGEDPRTQGWQRTRRPGGGRGSADPRVALVLLVGFWCERGRRSWRWLRGGAGFICLQGLLGSIAPAPGRVCITAPACPVSQFVTVLGGGSGGTQRQKVGRGETRLFAPFHGKKTFC